MCFNTLIMENQFNLVFQLLTSCHLKPSMLGWGVVVKYHQIHKQSTFNFQSKITEDITFIWQDIQKIKTTVKVEIFALH